jgi:5'-nucleotidase/UDP-sugar diphosphatase
MPGLNEMLAAAPEGKNTFTILHTNDIHSNLIGMGPSSDYTTDKLHDDQTRGGFARLATLLANRREARQRQGPVLVLDAGDYSMGTAFGAAIRKTGGELQLLSQMGCDATTFGNHEFDLGPDGLGQAISVAAKAGRVPVMLAANTDFSKHDDTLVDLQRLAKDNVIRRYLVIERGGIRFGIFGVIGKEAASVAVNAGAIVFTDPVETAREVVRVLRKEEKVDVVICLSHGGMERGADGTFTDGEDVRLPVAVPGIDVVLGGHSHTELHEPVMVHGSTPVVQTGKYGENLGELVITLDGGKLMIESYRLYPIDDTIAGDQAIADEIEKLKQSVTEFVFAPRGYTVDQPLAIVPFDLHNSCEDIAAGTILANLMTDSFRNATKADIAFSPNGLARAPLTRGKSGVQTVYDVFAVAPIGAGVVDTATAGSALVTAYITGRELKHLLEYCLIDSPTHPGEYFPRVSGMRFHYDPARRQFDMVTSIELGDFDHGYRAIDITGKDEQLYSLACSLIVGLLIMTIPGESNGQLALVPKNKDGQPLKSRVEALVMPRASTPEMSPPSGTLDQSSFATVTENGAVREIKDWQAIMDHLRNLPVEKEGELPTIPVDQRAAEVRAIRVN